MTIWIRYTRDISNICVSRHFSATEETWYLLGKKNNLNNSDINLSFCHIFLSFQG